MRLATSARQRDIRLAYLLLAPTVLLLLTVIAYPVGWEVWTSLTDLSPLKSGAPAFAPRLSTLALPFCVWILSAYFQQLPPRGGRVGPRRGRGPGGGTMEVALDELLAVAGINLMAIPVVLICAVFARGYVRGLTAAMVEGA